jgi:hypothetical protein
MQKAMLEESGLFISSFKSTFLLVVLSLKKHSLSIITALSTSGKGSLNMMLII